MRLCCKRSHWLTTVAHFILTHRQFHLQARLPPRSSCYSRQARYVPAAGHWSDHTSWQAQVQLQLDSHNLIISSSWQHLNKFVLKPRYGTVCKLQPQGVQARVSQGGQVMVTNPRQERKIALHPYSRFCLGCMACFTGKYAACCASAQCVLASSHTAQCFDAHALCANSRVFRENQFSKCIAAPSCSISLQLFSSSDIDVLFSHRMRAHATGEREQVLCIHDISPCSAYQPASGHQGPSLVLESTQADHGLECKTRRRSTTQLLLV